MTDIKLPFRYCKISRASELLGFKPQDFIHLAGQNKIELCLNIKPTEARVVYFAENEKEAIDIEREIYFIKENRIGFSMFSDVSFFYFHKSGFEYMEGKDFFQLFTFGEFNNSYQAEGYARGLWRVEPSDFLFMEDGVDITIPASSRLTFRAAGENKKDIIYLDLINDADEVPINEDNLWIHANDFNKVVNSNGDINSMSDIFDTSSDRSNLIDVKPLTIHPTAERHAINREQILSAALRLIEEQPNVFNDNCRKKDGSINYSAFARELLERHHFFPNGEPPIKTQEAISGILSNAYKSPNQK